MKTFLPTILLLVLLVNSSLLKAQTRFTFDYQTKKLSKVGGTDVDETIRVKPGASVNVNIINYNPLSTQFAIDDSSVIHYLNDTSRLSGVFTYPQISNIAPQPLSPAAKTELGKNTSEEKRMGRTTYKSLTASLSACDKLSIYMRSLNQSNFDLTDAITQYKNFLVSVDGIQDIYDRFKGRDVLNKLEITSTLGDEYASDLNNNWPEELDTLNTKQPVKPGQIKAAKANFLSKIVDIMSDVKDIKANFDAVAPADCATNYADYYKQFQDMYTALNTLYSTLQSDEAAKVIPTLNKDMTLLTTLELYQIQDPSVSLIVQHPMLADEQYVKIFAINGDGKKLLTTILVKPSKGFKVDVSGGLFGSTLADFAYSKTTKDSIYKTQYVVNGQVRDTIQNQTFSKISKENQANFSFGGALYVNGYWQCGRIFSAGFALGIGAMFNDQTRWALMGGIPLIFNGNGASRFIITPSVVFAQVDRLSSQYQTDTWYSQTINNIPTQKVWKAGFALGISWNFK